MSQSVFVACGEVKQEAEGGAGCAGDNGVVGRLVDSSQADDRKMIRLVRERRLLYARNNMPVASYHSQVKHLWQEVAIEMGWSVADVRRKWSHIRNSYSRHLRNEMHGARTAKGRSVSRWYLADELDFLREHMATDTRPSPYSFAPTFLEMDMSEQGAGDADVKPFIQNPWFSLSTSSPAAPHTALPPRPFDVKSESFNEDSSSSAFDPDENSSYFQFFRGIYNDYQELTAKKQRQFKRQCLGFLHQLLDEEESRAERRQAAGYRADQSDAVNLSSSAVVSDEEPDSKLCVVSSVETILPNK